MHGFEGVFDGRALIGRRLLSVQVAENVLSLTFAGHVNLSISNEVRYARSAGGRTRIAAPGTAAPKLDGLVGRKVTASQTVDGARLVLELEGGGFIELVDDLPEFECVVVTTPDKTYVI